MLKNTNEFKEWSHIQQFFQLPPKNMQAERKLYARTKKNKMFVAIMDAIIEYPSESKELTYWVDVYHLRQKYYEPGDSAWWKGVIHEMIALCEKWKNPLSIDVCCAMLDELEDYDRCQKGIITADRYTELYGNMRKDVVYE